MLYSVDQTHVLPPSELESLKKEMSDNEFRQEFLCDFNAANDNALIPIDLVREAVTRQYRESEYRDRRSQTRSRLHRRGQRSRRYRQASSTALPRH